MTHSALEALQALEIRATAAPRALGGGDIGRVWKIETDRGSLVVKQAAAPLLEAEQEGLLALAAVQSGLRVPRVLGLTPAGLVTEYLPPIRPNVRDQAACGQALRALHSVTWDRHGWERDNYCGPTLQGNTWTADGRVFQREQRLLPLAGHCHARGVLDAPLLRQLECVAHGLEGWLEDRPAALLHGDLWSGNLHFSRCGPALIDPAVYAHYPEVDLAMLELFGRPHPALLEAYWDGTLPDDWERRRALFQLYPLLNHLYLFGPGYLPGVRTALEILTETA